MQQSGQAERIGHDKTGGGRYRTTSPKDTELAATKIQAGFRGYQVRKHYHLHDQPDRSSQGHGHSPGAEHHMYSSPEKQYQQASVLNRTDADRAAAKIQASFRRYMTRREQKQHRRDICSSGRPVDVASTRNQKLNQPAGDVQDAKAPFRNRDQNSSAQGFRPLPHSGVSSSVVKSDHTQKSWNHSNPNDAATVIQANFRGYQTRKALHLGKEHNPVHHRLTGVADKENAEQAATRIQASYRGFRTRKQLEKMHLMPESRHQHHTSSHHIADPDEAATKIQAVFRGYSTRQRVHLPHSSTTHDQ
ncbi:hypothetical protein CSKR_202032 [Clonorchis sinensis]|uniref:Uncharacterized protein n=1 Tax=Clonorchis sinensis TaxID=79923 RepID=A0A3R7G103_CLOSI|nr:hypothetical protein CSKR_202032 [Clonorchis sinensis]